MEQIEETRPLVLVTNDDGYTAKGIAALTQAMTSLGDVVVVAPNGARSGQSSAITVGVPLRIDVIEDTPHLRVYSCSGTPVDCVKLALDKLLPRQPQLIVSGINHGSNAGASIVYSGTMGAALEGAIVGIPAIGFSLCSHAHDADFSHALPIVQELAAKVLAGGLPKGVCLNVNIPADIEPLGVRVCRQADGCWTEEYVHRVDPMGKEYYWLTGRFENREPNASDTDEWLLANGYVSVVPATCDMTAYDHLEMGGLMNK